MKALFRSTALVLSLAGFAGPALAQDTSPSDEAQRPDPGVGEIVVTAQKREENIQDVPIAISAVTSEFLESRGITSIDALGSVAPNVKIERAPSNKTAAQIAIRGSVTINPAITWEPAVGLYLDGVYVAKVQGAIFDIADLERVEVLRGPQGTLYGRNALAGAINLITAKPSGEFGVRAEVSYGSYDYRRAKAIVDLPALGPLAIKLSGQIQQRDGFIDIVPNPYPQAFLALPESVDETNDIDGRSFMAQARLDLGGPVMFDYTFDYSRNRQRPDFAQLVSVLPNSLFTDPTSLGAIAPLGLYANRQRQTTGSINGAPLYEYSRSMGHALTATIDLGAAEFKSITAYRTLDWEDSLDLDGSPLDVAFTQRLTEFSAFSQELQLAGATMSERLRYVLGAFYYREKAETLGPQFFFGFLNQLSAPGAAVLQSDYGGKTRAYAAYAQLDFDLSDAFTVTLGGRYTHEEKQISRFFGVGAPVTPLLHLGYDDIPEVTYENFSPAVTLAYELTDYTNLYARWARGFKSGGFNGEADVSALIGRPFSCGSAPGATSELCNPYRPEKVDSYEVGLKTRTSDGTLYLNLAAFWDERKDIQVSVFTAQGAAASEVRNAAAARIWGLELEGVVRPAPELTINASLAYLNAKYKSFIERGVEVSDNRAFPHTPEFTANIGATWDVVTGDWGTFSLIGDLNFVSDYYTFPYALVGNPYTQQIAGNTRSPGRAIVNLRAQLSEFDLGGAEMTLTGWVKNLTKEDNPQNFIDFGPGFGGLTLGYFPDPRTWGMTLAAEL